MTQFSTALIQSIPHVRRYALLTCDEPAAIDENVRIALDFVLKDEAHARPARLAMFATYQAVRSSMDLISEGRPHQCRPDETDSMAHAVMDLPMDERRALLLTAMEGFSEIDAAFILDEPPDTVAARRKMASERVKEALLDEYRESVVA